MSELPKPFRVGDVIESLTFPGPTGGPIRAREGSRLVVYAEPAQMCDGVPWAAEVDSGGKALRRFNLSLAEQVALAEDTCS